MLLIGFGFRAFLNPNRSGSASGILRRVRIQYPQLTAAKVSNPKFRGKCGNFLDISKGISQSGMCKFESSEISQPFPRLAGLPERRENGPGFPRVYRCTAEMRVKKPRLGRKIDMAPRLRGAFSFVPHDREAADAIQIDRIEFIASPSFDIRIGF